MNRGRIANLRPIMWHARIKELSFMNQSFVGIQYQFQEHERY